MTTIKEIAKKAGVSPGTVSKALSGRKDVSPITKRRIRKIAEELGYIPNFIARSLVTNKTHTIGLVTPYLGNPALFDRVRGVQNRCISSHYILITCLNEGEFKEEAMQIETLLSRKVDGLIITPSGESEELRSLIMKIECPVVLMSEMIEGLDYDFSGEDDYEGGKIATEYLITLGHRDIAYFGNSPDIYSDRCILKGYKDTLERYAIPYRSKHIFWGNTEKNTLEDNIEKLLSMPEPPTGIICWSDIIAIGVLNKLESMGKKVPGDISVVGYDNIEMLSLFHIPLTTIGQPNFLIGQKAVELLLERIENRETKEPARKVIFKPELIVRNSTGPVKSMVEK
ncbi:MAG: LacI family transcriptional regulator [Candidatus Omnitrophica bacterium]|nr:LacI family transcriptional regulator [Candidatus Omnitrophota bacterium]